MSNGLDSRQFLQEKRSGLVCGNVFLVFVLYVGKLPFQEILAGRENLTEQQEHLCNYMMHFMQLRGVPLSGQETKSFETYMATIAKECHKFK